MSKPIRISEELYNEAKKVARKEFRSIQRQIEFWALIGKTALQYPKLSIDKIKDKVIEQEEKR